MRKWFSGPVAFLAVWTTLNAQTAAQFDAAAAFGARASYEDVALSPDGSSISFVTPKGQGSALLTRSLVNKQASPIVAIGVDKAATRFSSCVWVGVNRLVCRISGLIEVRGAKTEYSRLCAVNADGSEWILEGETFNMQAAGRIMDLLPDRSGLVLLGTSFGVALLDTRSLRTGLLETRDRLNIGYFSDGRGVIRIKAEATGGAGFQIGPVRQYFYRLVGATGTSSWKNLSEYNIFDKSGFLPLAVDPDLNVAYGMKKLDGRMAIYSIALDGSLTEKLVFSRPDVDVEDLTYMGKRHRVVGATFIAEQRQIHYFEPELHQLIESLSKALPNRPALRILDSSLDEKRLLIFAARDDDPGTYYLFDRDTRQLLPLLRAREALEHTKLASVRPVTYTAQDGTSIPGFLTLPPGREDAKGLAAIVLPHGSVSSQDESGFNWLAQYFANRGFAVMQPNFRGTYGYGDSWYLNNGFQSWPTAISDVLDAGRWLVSQHIADPNKLGIVGWSYGGYAALQAAVVDSTVFKAVVAIAPITDLEHLKDQYANTAIHAQESRFIGTGAQVSAGSPAQNADKIKVPVLLFHGALDRDVFIEESKRMEKSLKSANVPVELVTWDELDHQLDDSAARATMLRQSEAFLLKSFGQ